MDVLYETAALSVLVAFRKKSLLEECDRLHLHPGLAWYPDQRCSGR
jgi:hypothetical protein